MLAFALGTIGAMAAFALAVGVLGQRFKSVGPRLYQGLMGACSRAAIGVGVFWLSV